MKKRLIGLLLICCLLVGCIPSLGITAQSTTVSSVPNGYTGIYTARDLDAVRNNLTGNYILMNDIDLGTWGDWEPIGYYGAFQGIFDGNGYAISNMTITDASAYDYAGLFAFLNGATVKNIRNISGMITTTDTPCLYAGGIAGSSAASTIAKCASSVTISYQRGEPSDRVYTGASGIAFKAGGIIGYAEEDSVITECGNFGTITGIGECVPMNVGGIVGWYYDVDILNCFNAGDLSARTSYISSDVGGICGNPFSTSRTNTITNCYNVGAVTCIAGKSASSYAGGIQGELLSWDKVSITNCYHLEGIPQYGRITVSSTGVANYITDVETCSAALLQNQSTFAGFDFDIVWKMGSGDYPYPVLQYIRKEKPPVEKPEITPPEEPEITPPVTPTISTPEQNLIRYKPKYSLSDSYRSGKYYQQLQSVTLTGDLRQDFVNIAKSQVGYHESSSADYSGTTTGSGNYTEYGRYVNNPNGGWCGFYAYWCIHAAGATDSVFPKNATGAGVKPYLTMCDVYTWKDLVDGNVTPQAGDLVIFRGVSSAGISDSSALSGGNHIEIVYNYRYDSVNDKYIFSTYGGNTGNGVIKDRPKLSCKNNGATGFGGNLEYIYAIVRPNWNVYSNPSSARKTVISFHCPIDIEISYNGETLSTITEKYSADFGTLTYHPEDDSYTATLDYHPDYDIQVTGKDQGSMDMSVTYLDAGEQLISQASFDDVAIVEDRTVLTSPLIAEKGMELYIYDKNENLEEVWNCSANSTANHVDEVLTAYYLDPTACIEDAIESSNFVDVSADAFYADAVNWAVENEITNGIDATHFGPGVGCTRAHVVTFLWRAAGCPVSNSRYNPFTDVTPGAYYYDAVLWAVEKGITTGISATAFGPDQTCTRGQIVTFLWRFREMPEVNRSENPFGDVPAGEYYYNAVLWAVENDITKGVSEDRFAPNDPCTRGQIVTFLHRADT